MRLCDGRFSRYANPRQILFKVSKENSHSRYISRMRRGVLIQPIAKEVFTLVTVTNIISHANFGACM